MSMIAKTNYRIGDAVIASNNDEAVGTVGTAVIHIEVSWLTFFL